MEIVPQAGDPGNVGVVLRGPAVEPLRRAVGSSRADTLFYMAVKGSAVPVLAARQFKDGECVLVPALTLTRGLTYEAVLDGPRLAPRLPRLAREYRVPADPKPSEARITGVYPTQERVPANLLKFYVYFSRPMGEGRVFEFARLLDGGGQPIRQAFHEIELWSADHRRLTLLINPGRTKRALGLSESMGPVLHEQRHYTLQIAAGLPDQHGRPLAAALRHAFRTEGFDRAQPSLQRWTIAPPKPGTRAALQVDFHEPLDRALAGHAVEVASAGGEAVPGTVALDPETRRWSLTPERPWASGEYVLRAEGELEDLAGNSLLRPFETETGRGARPAVRAPEFKRAFRIGTGLPL